MILQKIIANRFFIFYIYRLAKLIGKMLFIFYIYIYRLAKSVGKMLEIHTDNYRQL